MQWGTAAERLGVQAREGDRGAALAVGGVAGPVVGGLAGPVTGGALVRAAALAVPVACAIRVRGGQVEDHHVGLGADVLAEPHSLVAALRPPLLGQDGPHLRGAAPILGRHGGLGGAGGGHKAGGHEGRGLQGRGLQGLGRGLI